jgi:hypothetical protein
MEKKNTILLTVIAIATLLVAVVGATFAYFTATVGVDTNTEKNATTSVTTTTLPSATMAYGNKLEATGVYPGYKGVRSITITGTCAEGATCSDIKTKIIVTPTIASEFGNDVTWTLYKSTKAITCDSTDDNGSYTDNDGKYTSNYACKTADSESGIDSTYAEAVMTSNSASTNGSYEYEVTVNKSTNETYYLVVDYAETSANQDTAQGKTFSFELGFKAA